MNMKDMIQKMTDLENQAKQLNESKIEECGMPEMQPPMDQGSPVSMNVNISATGKDHVADLIDMMKNAGLNTAAPVSQDMMPMRQDMDRLRSIVNKTDTGVDFDLDTDGRPDMELELPREEGLEEVVVGGNAEPEDLHRIRKLSGLREADADQLMGWYKKYNKYDSADVKSLADGMFKFFQDSGVDLDTVEKSEYDALVAKHGEDKIEGNALRFLSDEDTPITKAMFDEFERIMGEPADEESSEKAVSLLGLDEGLEEVVVGGNAEPEDPDSVFARLMSDISEIQNGAMDDNDMADDIADELGDYLRNGDAPEGSHYEKAIGIVMDAIHDGPQAQAEAAEEAISFLHSAEEEARGNNESVEEVNESPEVEDFMVKIANSNDGYELMDQGLSGKYGPEIRKALQNMYDNVAVDNGYHPDDDFEKIHNRMIDNITDDYGTNEGYDNEPDPDYRDHHHMTKDLSGGINRQKKSYAAAQDGDNAMAVKIKEQLLAALAEKKMPMGPGPDGKKGTKDDKPAFLDQNTGAKKSKSDKKDGGMTDKQKKYFGKKK